MEPLVLKNLRRRIKISRLRFKREERFIVINKINNRLKT